MDEREISCRLVAVIFGPTYEDAKRQLYKINLADVVEFRLDLFDFFELEKVKALTKLCVKPFIFTYRKPDFPQVFLKLASLNLDSLNPDYLDIDYSTPLSLAEKIKKQHPQIKLICSYHNFFKTPDLDEIFQKLQNPIYDQYKIATKAQSSCCSFRMLDFVKRRSLQVPLTGVCMGEKGFITRILSPVAGNQMCFASIEETSFLPPMLSIDDLCRIYRFKKLNLKTQIFALLGKPVSHSIGHLFHNEVFEKKNVNAVYVKIDASEEELEKFFLFSEKLNFSGLSITMPYKEKVTKFCREPLTDYPINTLTKKGGIWESSNTDALAAVELLKEKTQLKGKKVCIIGAGGAAKAIALKLIEEKAHIIIFNRTLEKAQRFAQKVDCIAKPLKELFSNSSLTCDILIQASSFNCEKELLQNSITIPKIAVDLAYKPSSSYFLKYFRMKGAQAISGREFFSRQALLQQEIWRKQ